MGEGGSLSLFLFLSLYWHSCRSGSRMVRGGGVRVKQLLPIAVVRNGRMMSKSLFSSFTFPCTMTLILARFLARHCTKQHSRKKLMYIHTNLSRGEKISLLENPPSICTSVTPQPVEKTHSQRRGKGGKR